MESVSLASASAPARVHMSSRTEASRPVRDDTNGDVTSAARGSGCKPDTSETSEVRVLPSPLTVRSRQAQRQSPSGCGVVGSAPALGAGDRGFESLYPDVRFRRARRSVDGPNGSIPGRVQRPDLAIRQRRNNRRETGKGHAGEPPPTYRGVAQLGSALRSGRRSRRFKSCRPDGRYVAEPCPR